MPRRRSRPSTSSSRPRSPRMLYDLLQANWQVQLGRSAPDWAELERIHVRLDQLEAQGQSADPDDTEIPE